MKILRFIKEMFKKSPKLFMANILLFVLLGFFEAVSIFAIAPVVDFFLNSGTDKLSMITRQAITVIGYFGLPANLGVFTLIFLGFNLITNVLQILVRNLVLKIKYRVIQDLMVGGMRNFLRSSWYFFSSSDQGMLLNSFTGEVRVVGDALSGIGFFFTSLFQITLYFIVPFFVSWQVALISIAASVIFSAPFFIMGRYTYRLGKLNTSTANRTTSVLNECFGLAKTILGFGNQAKSVETLKEAFEAHKNVTIKVQTTRIAIPLLYYPLGLTALAVTLFAARQFAVNLSATAVILFSFLKIIPSIRRMTEWKNFLDSALPSYEQLMDLQKRARDMKQASGDRVFEGFKKEIKIENVSFAYPGHKEVLGDINVVIPRGRMTAFVGVSGSGKTTLIDMIMGFFEPTNGRILVDGVKLREFEINSYRHKIGYVSQNAVLFNTSIRENLLWANKDSSQEDIMRACKQANAEEFIKNLAKGYDTIVGDRGVRLSGGQMQRIALAMALLRRPDILILDEATSSLDAHSERLIQEAVDAISKEVTVIAVAHRFSTIKRSDNIYVLEGGRIVEEGSFDGMMKTENSKFKKMCEMQSLKGE